MEWFDSPIIYRKDDEAFEQLKSFAQKVAGPPRMISHYLSIAPRTWDAIGNSETIKLKRYFYVLRPLLAARYLREYDRAAPMQFGELVEAVSLDCDELDAIDSLLERKMKLPETGMANRISVLDRLIEKEFDQSLPMSETESVGIVMTQDANLLFKNLLHL